MIKVSTNYLEHSSNTKFYEVVTLASWDDFFMVIKRWGKIAENMGGGQTKVERYSSMADAAASVISILKDKRRDKGAKGRYLDVTTAHALHAYANSSMQEKDLPAIARNHYHDKSVCEAVSQFFNSGSSIPARKRATPEPEPSAERGEVWGSW